MKQIVLSALLIAAVLFLIACQPRYIEEGVPTLVPASQ